MLSLFGRQRAATNRAVIERLNAAVIGATQAPAFYEAGGVPDTFNGRFELLVLHAALALRRLRAAPDPAPAMAQALVDLLFRNLDPALRELGVGDMAVPKRMKALAEAFLGRAVAYERALAAENDAPLRDALARNIYAGSQAPEGLRSYVLAAAALLDETPGAALAEGSLRFPDPTAFLH